MPTSEAPRPAEFFMAAAGVAGPLWVVAVTLFTFFTTALRARFRGLELWLVVSIGFLIVLGVSGCFLTGILVSLGELMPPGQAGVALWSLATVTWLSYGAFVYLTMRARPKVEPGAKQSEQRTPPIKTLRSLLTVALVLCALPIAEDAVLVAFLLSSPPRRSPPLEPIAAAALVVGNIAAGCLYSLMAAMAATLAPFLPQTSTETPELPPIVNNPCESTTSITPSS
jgi:hypothetical protein